MIALVALVLVAGAFAQQPKRCITPPVWEGRSSTYDHGASRHDRGRVAYDAVNERVRFTDEIDVSAPGRHFYEHLILFKERVQYRIDLGNRVCKKEDIDPKFSWQPFGIPENATFDYEGTIGALEETITATTWKMPAYDHPQGWEWHGTFSMIHCVPIHEVVAYNVSDSISRHFYDITLGLSDPNTFIPPSECN